MNKPIPTTVEMLDLMHLIQNHCKAIFDEARDRSNTQWISKTSVEIMIKSNRELVINLHRLRRQLEEKGAWQDE